MNHFLLVYFQKISFWLMIVSIVFLSACQGSGPHQAYEGSAKMETEVATFILPGEYNLLSIDGTKFKQLALKDGAVVKLLPGSHQLIIEYYDFFDLGGGEFEKIGSKPIAITFTAEAGNQYSVNSVTFEEVEKAQAFAEKPSINITNTTNKQTVSAEIKYNLYGKGLFTTLFGKSNSEPTTTQNETGNTYVMNKEGKALEMLKYWWEAADENQQENFRQWLKK
jgi:uncharacterized protein YccT (UPF0319 family)